MVVRVIEPARKRGAPGGPERSGVLGVRRKVIRRRGGKRRATRGLEGRGV